MFASKRKRAIKEKDRKIRELEIELDEIGNKYNSSEKENRMLKEENTNLRVKNLGLQKENREMVRKLDFYESNNMPSSVPNLDKENKMRKKATERKRTLKKPTQPGEKSGPRGVEGHKGNTKVLGDPDEEAECEFFSCPDCKSEDVEITDETKYKDVEDVEVVKVKVIRFIKRKCRCLKCGSEFYSRHKDCPLVGKVGNKLTAKLTVNRYMAHGSLGTCELMTETNSKFKTTRQTVNAAINRVIPAIEPEYEKIVENTKNAFVRYADETGHNLNGAKKWLWVSVVMNAVLYMFGDRGKNTAEKLLGTVDDILKILSVDGWKAYNKLGFLIQRCWAHLLRKVEAKDRNDIDAVNFQNAIKSLFKEIKKYRKNFPDDVLEIAKMYNHFIDRSDAIIAEFKGIKSIEKQLKYFKNGGCDWLTCVLFGEVEMTNNTAERYIRDIVIDRKIFYCFRSQENIDNYAIMKSVIMTWRKNGFNVFDKLVEALENYNANGVA